MDTLRKAGLTPSSKFDFKDVPDLSGKVAVVTGGSAGIGRSAVKALADGGARVIFLSNKEEHKDEAYESWEKEIDTAKVESKQVDLADLKATLEVAKVLANEERIDIVMANAGLGVGKPFSTPAGFDAHMTINHLSQLLLLNRLLPVLRRTVSSHPPPPSARIVFQSSELHRAAKGSTTFSEEEFADAGLGPLRAYSRTKLAQVLTCKGLLEKAKLDGRIKSLVAHPGGVETDQQRQGQEAYGVAGKAGRQFVKPMTREPDHGALCSVWCAVSPKIDETDSQGKYYNDPDTEGHETKQADDEGLLETLWTSSEKVIRKHAGEDALISWTAEGA